MSSESPEGPHERMVGRLRNAIAHSHNFATAKPNIAVTEREHIIGLCSLLGEAAAEVDRLRAEVEALRRTLHEIAEEWAGAECGEPVHAQEAYAIGLAKRMYSLAVEGLTPN